MPIDSKWFGPERELALNVICSCHKDIYPVSLPLLDFRETKMCLTSRHDREGLLITSHGLPYIISNLTMWTITTLKGFRIGACIKEISMGWKLTLGMKHPVLWLFVLFILSVLSLEEETFSAAGYNLLSHDASVVDQVNIIQWIPSRFQQGSAKRWSQVVWMLRASPGRSGKQQQEQNSPNLGKEI